MQIEIMTGKRKSFSLNEKHSLLEAHDKLPKTSQRAFETAALCFQTVSKKSVNSEAVHSISLYSYNKYTNAN